MNRIKTNQFKEIDLLLNKFASSVDSDRDIFPFFVQNLTVFINSMKAFFQLQLVEFV